MDRDALIHRLAETVAGDTALLRDGWTHLVLVSRIDGGTLDMTGFCYTSDGRAVPASPKDFSIFGVLAQLRDAMAQVDGNQVDGNQVNGNQVDGKKPWIAALFRIERATGKLTADFEYDRPERWMVTPTNVKARAREFAPA